MSNLWRDWRLKVYRGGKKKSKVTDERFEDDNEKAKKVKGFIFTTFRQKWKSQLKYLKSAKETKKKWTEQTKKDKVAELVLKENKKRQRKWKKKTYDLKTKKVKVT